MKPLLVVDSAALSWAMMSQEQRKGVCKVGITEHDKNDAEGSTEAGRENRNNENTPLYPPNTLQERRTHRVLLVHRFAEYVFRRAGSNSRSQQC